MNGFKRRLFGLGGLGASVLLVGAGANEPGQPPTKVPQTIELRDQFDSSQSLVFPRTNHVVLAIADRKGAGQVEAWVTAIWARYADRVEIRGLADVGGVPGFLRGRVRAEFRKSCEYPVMLDWSGDVCAKFKPQPGVAEILLIDRLGNITGRWAGVATRQSLSDLFENCDRELNSTTRTVPSPGSVP